MTGGQSEGESARSFSDKGAEIKEKGVVQAAKGQ